VEAQSLARQKAAVREEVWRRLEEGRVATPRACRGRIPLFAGSRVAAARAARAEVFRRARVVYASSDPPLQPLREEVLRAGKQLVMMLPGFRGFVVVDGGSVPRWELRRAASLPGAAAYGSRVRVLKDVRVDLVLLPSLAVDRAGGRLGSGDGRHDLEYAVLRELRAVDDGVPVLTVVHDLQLVERVPMGIHDVPADYIATPSALLKAEGGYRKPLGVIWDLIDSETVERMPLLRLLAGLG